MATEDDSIYRITIDLAPAFEGAQADYKTGLRDLHGGEADSLAVRELRFLQNRNAAICRNNGYGAIALKNWTTNLNFVNTVWKTPTGKAHKLMQGYWDSFAKDPWYDSYGDIKTGVGTSNSSIFVSGASYIRTLVKRTLNQPIPFKLQLIPACLHAVEYSMYTSNVDRVIKYGIEFEKSIPINYFFHKSLLEQADYTNPLNYTTVPAAELIHTFHRDEPGQWIGIPKLAPVIMSLYGLDDLMTATVTKQKAAQSIGLVIEQAASALSMTPAGPVKTKDTNDKPKIHYQNSSQESQVIYLEKGESIKTFQGEDIGANFSTLAEIELRKIALTADCLYHQLTGDMSGLNYSSLLGAAVQSRNRLEYLQNVFLIPMREQRIATAFKNLAVLYNSKCSNAIPYFQLPRWRGYDDLKDAQADILELQNGLGTVKDKLAERGLTVEEVLADAEERKAFEAFGIVWNTEGANPSLNQTNNISANSNSTGT